MCFYFFLICPYIGSRYVSAALESLGPGAPCLQDSVFHLCFSLGVSLLSSSYRGLFFQKQESCCRQPWAFQERIVFLLSRKGNFSSDPPLKILGKNFNWCSQSHEPITVAKKMGYYDWLHLGQVFRPVAGPGDKIRLSVITRTTWVVRGGISLYFSKQ